MKTANELVSFENAVSSYEQFVEALPVSFDEKYMLRSLIAKQRIGELEIFFNDKREAKIILRDQDEDKRATALSLLKILQTYLSQATSHNQQISFLFTE